MRSRRVSLLMSVCSLVFSVFVMMNHIYKYPRLYLNDRFEKNGKILFEKDHTHYLKNVLRKNAGDCLRVFNGRDGEWIAQIEDLGKKSGQADLTECIKAQPENGRSLHLFFSPIKKQRMDMLIEKAVELGVTDLHPVIMNRTENRKMNEHRVHAQIVEAAEQCERLDIPVLHDLMKLPVALSGHDGLDLYVAMERENGSHPISGYSYRGDCGFIIGPEGGFDDAERALLLSVDKIKSIDLGERILRAETAVIACLSYAQLSTAGANK